MCSLKLCSIDGKYICCQGYRFDHAQNKCIRMFLLCFILIKNIYLTHENKVLYKALLKEEEIFDVLLTNCIL